MGWTRLGQIYPGGHAHPKLQTHAANPVAMHLGDDLFRFYFSARDAAQRSSVGWIEYDLGKRRLTRVTPEPAFLHGAADSYYAHGVSLGGWYEANGQTYLLFMGWQRTGEQRWRGEIGRLRVCEDGGLALADTSPLIGVDADDPISLAYPCVVREPGGQYRLWYPTCLAWDLGNGEKHYVLKEARSADGHTWEKTGTILPVPGAAGQVVARPTALLDADGSILLWYSVRNAGENYRIGHARRSPDGSWETRDDEGALFPAHQGWDSEMVEYPWVFSHHGKRYMLYCGNRYGLTGFGLAVATQV